MIKSILLFFVCFVAINLQGQDSLRVIKGFVTDQAGQALANKKVEARFYDCADNTNQEIILESFSNEEGYYELWLDICADAAIIVIAYCGEDIQSVDILSFYGPNKEINFSFDCNFDYNCDASFNYTFGEPDQEEDAIPVYFTVENPNHQNYFYEFSFLGMVGKEVTGLDTRTAYYPTYGQYTVCMQTYIIGDPFTVICEYCESIDAGFAFLSSGVTNTKAPDFVDDINLFPNPVSNESQLVFNLLKKEELTIEISNLLGQVFKQQHLYLPSGKNQLLLDFNNYPSGLYLVNVKSANGGFSKRVLKK